MSNDFEIQSYPLTVRTNRERVTAFLAANGLRLDALDYYAVVTAVGDDQILAGGGLDKDIIKCIAVSDTLRDEGISATLVSHLMSIAMSRQYEAVKVFTKPSNQKIFESLGFHLLAEAPKAILLENGLSGWLTYERYLKSLRREGKSGLIVMNANPFTRGHRFLISQAARQVDTLFIIPVKEDRSEFSYAERKAMLEAGCSDLENVIVCEGSDYSISAATFPTYFLKELDEAATTQMSLDLSLFAKRIAPALGAKIRFVGSEPLDAMTQRYNELMHELLPLEGISVVEIARLSEEDRAISASAVRAALDEGKFSKAAPKVNPTTIPYLLAKLATMALQSELDTSPKPGLVDTIDAGAHQDMDYNLMCRSIRALHPHFVALAQLGYQEKLPTSEEIRRLGLEAEREMLLATDNVNTHKGALFAMGLVLIAAAHNYYIHGVIQEQPLRADICRLAADFPAPQGTHGDAVRRQYNVGGALAQAVAGYTDLFADWLPYLRQLKGDTFAAHKTLLYIMTTLDDTNILHRKGAQVAFEVKEEARALLSNFSEAALIKLNQRYIKENISPGGSADILSLTFLLNAILS
ncbi:[citrate (pro-3S)-lyase] ligase [Alloprevotella tannerae]|uniref:[citrate (pro-3S)-lyase] ligase n=1 Tax=Alloprevotella tannerae TaxID=76122 RepID=UPI0028E6D08E|nr:[citrate (pro-3S)-lyase] ligase [Alloprevotella tannerae]